MTAFSLYPLHYITTPPPGEKCGLGPGVPGAALPLLWALPAVRPGRPGGKQRQLLILLAGVMVPIVHPGDLAGDAGVDAGISGYNGVNFLLTGEWRLRNSVLISRKPMATEAHGIFTDNFRDLRGFRG